MKNLFKLFSIILVSLTLTNCEEYDAGAENSNSVLNYGFKKSTDLIELPETAPVYKMVVFATETSNVDRVLTVNFDAAASTVGAAADFTFPGTITIPAGQKVGEGVITFNFSNLVIGVEKLLVFNLTQPTDGSVANISASKTQVKYTPLCLYNKVTFNLVLDRYGSETTWNIKKGGVTVASGGPYTDGDTNALQAAKSFTYCLDAGSYVLTVNDAYGDGLFTSASVQGSYNVKLANGTVLATGGGNFGTQSVHNFTLN